MRLRKWSFVLVVLGLFQPNWVCGQRTSDYRVRHNYRTNLNANQVIRGQWKYSLKDTAYSRSGGWVRRKERDIVGPFQGNFAQAETLTATSGGASATSNASVNFGQNGGWHQVDGVASIGGDGRYARAFSSSALAINTGTRRANGQIRWQPNWRIDRISGSRRVNRDPVELVVTDLDSGNQVRDTLFDLHVDIGEGGSGYWENGMLNLRGVDGTFRVDIGGQYLTSKPGTMLLEYNGLGVVTRSFDSGVFDGVLPAVGELANLDMDVSQYVGDAQGNIDLDYDFNMQGNLDLTANMSGDGVADIVNGDGLLIQDFSHVNIWENPKVLFGTPFMVNSERRSAEYIVPDSEEDPYSGFLRMGVDNDQPMQMVTFDAASDRMGEHVHSSFDFRLQDESIPGQRPEDGLAYLLLPTDVYGEQGIDETLLGPDFSAEQPTALGGLGLGLQPFGNQNQQGAIVTLAWDGQPVARAQFLPQDPAFGNLSDWNQALIDVQRVDDGGLVNIALAGPDGQPMPLLDPVFIPGMSLDGVFRPAFTTHAMAGLALRDIDNLVLDYGLSLLGDFNHDGMFDVQDINRLAEAIAFGASDQNLDLTGDSAVDQQDLTAWVKDIQGTWFGDSDLSGAFDSTDLVRVFQAGKYETGETALWSEGDWNADGLFDTSDMILAFQDGGFERTIGASVRTAAVPELNSTVLAVIALLGLSVTRRRFG